MLKDCNYWATYKDAVISWYGELPSPAELGMERVFDFTRRVLDAGEREQVMSIIESPKPWLFKREAGWTWLDYVRARFEQEGRVILFPGGGPTHQTGGRLRIPARLAYYQGDRIVEGDVEDPGLLLQSLQSGEHSVKRYSTTPICLDGDSRSEVEPVPGKPPNENISVALSLYTDIWLPRVIGLHAGDNVGRARDGIHPARGHDMLMDNSALAARHTPRLNRFIQTLRDAVLELGGAWSFDPGGVEPDYLRVLYDGGINIDPPTANA